MSKKTFKKDARRAAKARRLLRWQDEMATALITGGEKPLPFEVYNRMALPDYVNPWFTYSCDSDFSHREGKTKRGVTKYRRT